MLIIEWVGYSFVKHMLFHYFIMITHCLERLNLEPCVLKRYYDRFVVGLVGLSLQVGYYEFEVAFMGTLMMMG